MENSTNEKNELKKVIYKVTPKATFIKVRDGIMYYESIVDGNLIEYRIPLSDTQEADFLPEMDGKYLLRWIYVK